MMNSKFNNKSKYIIPTIWNLISNTKKPQHPLEGWNSKTQTKTVANATKTKTPDLKELNKQIFFSLTPSQRYRKESLLTDSSTAYLNTVHPTKLRVNLNEAPSTKTTTTKKQKTKNKKQTKTNKKSGLRFASLLQLRNKKQQSKTSNEIYEYLKTFSKYRERKPGLLKKKL